MLLQLASAHKDLYILLECDFCNVDITDENDPTTKAVLLARTQLARTAEIIPDIQAKAEKHKEMLSRGENPPGTHGDLLCY